MGVLASKSYTLINFLSWIKDSMGRPWVLKTLDLIGAIGVGSGPSPMLFDGQLKAQGLGPYLRIYPLKSLTKWPTQCYICNTSWPNNFMKQGVGPYFSASLGTCEFVNLRICHCLSNRNFSLRFV